MMGTDFDQTYRFIEILRNNRHENVCWQLFNDVDNGSGYPVNFTSSFAQAEKTITQYQEQGYGAYITINPTDGYGRKIENITSYDYLFADIDGNLDVNNLQIPIKPLLITGRDSTHAHIYFPVEGITSEKQYNYLQKMIALYFGSDQQVIDPCRVARVPGLLHLKNPNDPKVYKILQDNSAEIDFNYTFDEIKAAFQLNEDKQKTLDTFIANREALKNGDGFNDLPCYRDQMIHWAKQVAPISVKGEGRSYNLIRVALFGYDRGVTLDEVKEILWEHYNPRCEPPWTIAEKDNFDQYIENGFNYSNNAPGCKTATAIDWGEVPEPAGGWENHFTSKKEEEEDIPYTVVVDDVAYITREQAANNTAFVTQKSSVYELALKYIGDLYPYKTLVRNDKTFYHYNNIHWQEITDEAIKAQVYIHFACWKFPPSKMNNIFETIVNLTYENNIKRSTWLNDPNRDGSKCIILKNGIIDIQTDDFTLLPHDRNFFELTALPYDYDPNANCNDFLNFLNSQFPNDLEMHNQMQELYGLALSNNSNHQRLPLMIGKSGTGKSVHRAILSNMLGGKINVISPSLEGLLQDHTIEAMGSKKLAVVPEANNVHHFLKEKVLDRLKAISGGDPVYHDRKYKGGGEVDVWPLLLLQCNEFVNFLDPSGALARRIWPFKFTISFIGREDNNMETKLTRPQSISGIFNWALKGLARVHANNNRVTYASSSKDLVSNIQYDTFVLSSFVEDFCILDSESHVYIEELYEMYLIHAKSKGQKNIFNQTKFSQTLDSSHLAVTRMRESKPSNGTKRRYYFVGIRLSDIAVQKHKNPTFDEVPQPIPFSNAPPVK